MARALAAVFLLVLFSAGAAAQSCGALRAELARAQSGGGAALARLQQKSSAFGCNRNSRFGQPRACAGIKAQIARARRGAGGGARVRQLRRQVARACAQRQRVVRQAPQGASRGQARVVRRQRGGGFFRRLFNNDWAGDEVVVVDPSTRRGRGSVERVTVDGDADREEARRKARLARGNVSDKRGRVTTQATRSRSGRGSHRVGSSRTVCVRLCDGFYFPINAHSHSDNFYDEHAMCVGRCPGADVSLYVHHAGAPVESMRSAMTNERYVDLPTAFDYRKERVGGCGCQPQSVMASDMTAQKALDTIGIEAKHADASRAETALTANDATPERADWRRFKAVYDETGRPLDLSIAGANHGTRAAASAVRPAASSERTSVTLPLKPYEADAAVRPVGPQSYSQTVVAFEKSKRRRTVIPQVTSTAVTVVPLADSALPDQGVSSDARAEATERGGGPAARDLAGRTVENPGGRSAEVPSIATTLLTPPEDDRGTDG